MKSAKIHFEQNIVRVKNLGAIYKSVNSQTTQILDLSDILRAQYVMLVSALDHFIHENNIEPYKDNIWLDYQIRYKNSFKSFQQANKIEEALDLALSKPTEIMKALEKFVQLTHPYNDGKSSARVIDACLDFLKNNKVKRKPLNLIRKYKIRKKLGYFKI